MTKPHKILALMGLALAEETGKQINATLISGSGECQKGRRGEAMEDASNWQKRPTQGGNI